MPLSFVPLTPVQITVTGVNYNWSDVNVSALVPAGATGAILYVENNNPVVRDWCVRPKGSTHTLGLQSVGGNQHCYSMVGLDANGVFEFNNVSGFPTKIQLYLVGYTMPGAEFLAEPVDISPAAPHLVWTQVNLGPAGLNLIPATAIGVMVDVFAYGGVHNYGLRMNGSTDNRTTAFVSERSNGVQVVGCDANQIIEAYRSDIGTRLFLVGYITAGAAFLVNGLDVTPTALGVILPLGEGLPTTAVIAFLEIAGLGGRYFLDDVLPGAGRYLSSTQHVAAYCPTSDWQGRLENAAQIFALGYSLYVAPTVTTNPATLVEEETAIGNGNITNIGSENCDKRGICWNTTGNPTIADNKSEETDSFGTGVFSRPITDLSPGTKYYVKAYAHNLAGYSYGSEESFTTKPNAPSNLACVGQSSSQIDVNWIKGTGATKTMVRRKIGSYPSDVTDGDQAYYGIGNSFNDTPLVQATHYYYRAWSWVEGGDIWSDDYAEDNEWTLIGAPAVTTGAATGLAAVSATLNGTLDDDGGEACECGFEWGLSIGYGTTTPPQSKTTGETFSQVIGGLQPGTTYHFRAFATNSVGTSHGADRSFATALVISRGHALGREEL
ncbi:hypothetical protein ES707_00214 [subsurface metagenome]